MPNHVESCFGLIVSLCNSAEAAACGRHESSLALRFDMVAAVPEQGSKVSLRRLPGERLQTLSVYGNL